MSDQFYEPNAFTLRTDFLLGCMCLRNSIIILKQKITYWSY